MKRNIAAFDFDGTLTTSDTMIPFMNYALGNFKFLVIIIKNSFWIIMYLFKLYPNWKTKQRLFKACFKGWSYESLEKKAIDFAKTHNYLLNSNAVNKLKEHIAKNNKVYIISASIDIWVKPFFKDIPNIVYITTEIEIINDIVTGSFKTKNCYGKEKVNRLKQIEPIREEYTLYAYGDSKGDKYLLNYAEFPFYRHF